MLATGHVALEQGRSAKPCPPARAPERAVTIVDVYKGLQDGELVGLAGSRPPLSRSPFGTSPGRASAPPSRPRCRPATAAAEPTGAACRVRCGRYGDEARGRADHRARHLRPNS